MIYSPLLKDSLKGRREISLVSQTDVPAILENIKGEKFQDDFTYSISPFNERQREFVYYAYYDGAAVFKNDTAVYYDNISKLDFAITVTDSTKFKAPNLAKKAKLYQQTVMEDFFNLSKNTD